MKLKRIASKVKQGTVSFFKDPKKVQGLAIGIVGTLTAALLVDEVKTSKHKKEVKDAKNQYLGIGVKCGNLDTLTVMNRENKISKEEAIFYGNQYDDFITRRFGHNDLMVQNYNNVAKTDQEKFEDMLN